MASLASKSLTWLIAAVYLLDGVLAGIAHCHSHSPAECGHTAQVHQHEHGACENEHRHEHAPGATDAAQNDEQENSRPAAPHPHDDCAACRYSSLQAGALHMADPVELEQAIASVAVRLPVLATPQVVALHLARGPPLAA